MMFITGHIWWIHVINHAISECDYFTHTFHVRDRKYMVLSFLSSSYNFHVIFAKVTLISKAHYGGKSIAFNIFLSFDPLKLYSNFFQVYCLKCQKRYHFAPYSWKYTPGPDPVHLCILRNEKEMKANEHEKKAQSLLTTMLEARTDLHPVHLFCVVVFLCLYLYFMLVCI